MIKFKNLINIVRKADIFLFFTYILFVLFYTYTNDLASSIVYGIAAIEVFVCLMVEWSLLTTKGTDFHKSPAPLFFLEYLVLILTAIIVFMQMTWKNDHLSMIYSFSFLIYFIQRCVRYWIILDPDNYDN